MERLTQGPGAPSCRKLASELYKLLEKCGVTPSWVVNSATNATKLVGYVKDTLNQCAGSRENRKAMLEEVHKRARFPVIPHYYWWTAPGEGMPKGHLVLPISPKPTEGSDVPEGFALLGIGGLHKASIPDELLCRLHCFFQALAFPLMTNFYRAGVEHLAADAEWGRISDSIGHALREPSILLQPMLERAAKRLSDGDQDPELTRIVEDAKTVLRAGNGMALMSGWLVQASKKDYQGDTFCWSPAGRDSEDALVISADFLKKRVQDAMQYTTTLQRKGNESEICEKLSDTNLVHWACEQTRIRLFRDNPVYFQKLNDLAPGATWAIIAETLINAIRHNNPEEPGLKVAVTCDDQHLTFLVFNFRIPGSEPIRDLVNPFPGRDQRGFAGLRLVGMCLRALQWDAVLCWGDDANADLPSDVKNLAGATSFDLHQPFQVIGFRARYKPGGF